MKILISVAQQTLSVLDEDGVCLHQYSVSTAAKGVGELAGSYQTPRGEHYIRAKIGDGLPLGAVLKGRRPTGEVWSSEFAAAHPGRDWVLTRILWLCGRERGLNRLKDAQGRCCDTMQRYVYIHGTADTAPMGVPLSHGCIRMRNRDVADLFTRVPVGCPVRIEA